MGLEELKGLNTKSNRLTDARLRDMIFCEMEIIEDNEIEKYNITSTNDSWFCNIYIPPESILDNYRNDYFENNIFNTTKFTADMNTMLCDELQKYEAKLHDELQKNTGLSMTLFYGLLAAEEIYIAEIGPIWGIYVDYRDIEKNAAIYEAMIDDIIGNFSGSKRLEEIYARQKPSNGYIFSKDEIDVNSLTLPKKVDTVLLEIMKGQSIDEINTDFVAGRALFK